MKISTLLFKLFCLFLLICNLTESKAQTLSFPGAEGFGRFAPGARASATKEVYVVSNLNDSGIGSFRDAVSKSGRIVVFSVGGIIRLNTDVSVASNITIAGQTAPGDGIVISNKRVTFTSANNTICRFIRLRLGATGNSGKDVSGLASGANMIFDHMSFTWAMDEVFSINYDGKGTSPDNITIQNSIIGQGLHRENHSAGGLIQTPDGGKVSLIKNLYISNKTRNPKVKGVNEFVNNVVYNWGNGNRLGDNLNYGWSGEGYIMGGSSGVSEVNVINNYFVSGPLTPPSEKSPFSRGTGSFNIYGAGNYYDSNKNGVLDGTEIPYNNSPTGYPGITAEAFKMQPYAYPAANPTLSAEQAYQHVIDNVGATYPRRDELDAFMVDEVASKGVKGFYVYRETDLPLVNGGLGNVFGAPAPLDSDNDGMPDAWEDANGLNKNYKDDAVAMSNTDAGYLNIEVYINQLTSLPQTSFLRPPSNLLAGNITPSSLNLSWTDNSDSETHFILERSTNGTSYIVIDTLDANLTTYSDSGLLSNQTYYYRIKGINVNEFSAYASLTAKTATAPSAPSVPSAPSPANMALGVDTINRNLTWTGSANSLSYKVYFGTDSTVLAFKGDVTAPSYPLSGLLENTVYYWRIDAINNLGTTLGDMWSFKTLKNYPPALVGDWRFDETLGTVAADSSSFRNDAEINDVPDYEWQPGKINNAINLQSMTTASGILVPNEEHLLLDKTSFSFSLWVKAPAQSSASKYLFHKGTFARDVASGTTGKWFGVELKDGNLSFSVDDDVTKSSATTSTSAFFDNNWNHLVVVRDISTKKLRVYKNGALLVESNDNTIGGIAGDEPLVIANTNSFNAPFTGMLDEMKAYNYVLSENDILRLYHTSPLPLAAYSPSPVNTATTSSITQINVSWKGGINTTVYKVYFGSNIDSLSFKAEILLSSASYQFTGLNPNTSYFWRVDAVGPEGVTAGPVWSFKTPFPQGIVASLKLDATSGTAIIDSTSYQTNGTLQNITDYTWEAGRVNNGLNLKTVNANSAIRIPSKENILFNKNSFSISLWVKGAQPAVPSVSSYMLFKGTFAKNATTGATGRWYGVELKSGNIFWSVDDDVTKSTVSMSSSTFLNNTWVNVVFVRDVVAKKLRIYKNGVLAVEGNDNTGIANGIGGIEPLTIANSQDLNSPFKGMLDEVKMFNYVLSPSEITGLAAAKDAQNITFAALPDKKMTDADFDAGATATSGLDIVYSSSDSSVATIINSKIHLVGEGAVTITASQPGNASYLAAISVSQTFTVSRDMQNIVFNALPGARIGDSDIVLTASASSGLPVSYMSSNESVAKITDGKIHITGAGSTVISASQAGNETYEATSASQQFIVTGYNVQVLYQDGDNGQRTNNAIKPFLKVINQDSVSLAYGELSLRYYITAENFAGINTYVDYAQIGNNKVAVNYIPLAQPLNGALGYLEYSFSASAGVLSPSGNSGVIQSRVSNKDYGVFNESDDYSYKAGGTYATNSRITLYRNGSLIWGTEPAATDSILKVRVLAENKNNNTNSNSISTTLVINNEGNVPLAYEDLSVRYWFTAEGPSALNYWIDYAKLGANKFSAQFVKPSQQLIKADTYLEIKPASTLGELYPLSSTGSIQYRIAKTNWSAFNETNDHSFKPKAPLAENAQITVYYKGQLIYGIEPLEGNELIAGLGDNGQMFSLLTSLNENVQEGINTYPNPSQGNFTVNVNSPENGKITIAVYSVSGLLVQTLSGNKDGAYQKQLNLAGLPAGTYYLRVNVKGFSQTKAILVY